MDNQESLLNLKKDFRLFLYLTWKHLGLPSPTPIQYDIAWHLQHGPKRKIIQAFRGVGKSWITSAYVCWRLFCNPNLRFLVVSASKVRADDFSTFTKRLIHEMPLLSFLKARSGQRDSNIAFEVGPAQADHSPSVKSIGITGQLTGTRADEIIADDIEVINNSLTQTLRDKLSEAVKEFDAIIKPNESSRITFLGTPQSEMTLYNILPERGYQVYIWPARYPKLSDKSHYQGRLASFIEDRISLTSQGCTTDPDRFSDLDLAEREASYGKAGFALQFMLDARLSDVDRYPLRVSNLVTFPCNLSQAPTNIIWASGKEHRLDHLESVGFPGDYYYKPMHISPDWAPYEGSVMYIDPSGRGQDETAYAIVKLLHGTLYCLKVGGFRGGYEDGVLRHLSQQAKTYEVNLIKVESNFGDGMFSSLLKPVLLDLGYPCTIEEERVSSQKELRIIDSLEAVLGQHRLVMSEKVIEEDLALKEPRYSLIYQFTRLTRDKGSLKNDDRLEALAGAVRHFTSQLAQNSKDLENNYKDQLKLSQLEEFMEQALGQKPVSSTWISH